MGPESRIVVVISAYHGTEIVVILQAVTARDHSRNIFERIEVLGNPEGSVIPYKFHTEKAAFLQRSSIPFLEGPGSADIVFVDFKILYDRLLLPARNGKDDQGRN